MDGFAAKMHRDYVWIQFICMGQQNKLGFYSFTDPSYHSPVLSFTCSFICFVTHLFCHSPVLSIIFFFIHLFWYSPFPSCHVMSCHVMSCQVLSFHDMSSSVMSCHVCSFLVISISTVLSITRFLVYLFCHRPALSFTCFVTPHLVQENESAIEWFLTKKNGGKKAECKLGGPYPHMV